MIYNFKNEKIIFHYFIICFSAMQILFGCFLCLLFVADAKTAIIPPPWANPIHNPCAVQPRGWQLLYWPDDGKCYKIFQVREKQRITIFSQFDKIILNTINMLCVYVKHMWNIDWIAVS